jgi:uncharacterized protein (DUF1501 family)
MWTRRQFLGGSAGMLAIGAGAPGLWRQAARAAGARRDGRILVVLELSGGNDGLNTVVPHADDAYHRSRPTLHIEASKALKLDDRVGLHPALKDLHRVWNDGALSVVQGVGYPDPNRSHFRSMAIWQTGTTSPPPPDGWLGRLGGQRPHLALCHVGQGSLPLAIQGRNVVAQAVPSLAEYRRPPGAEEDPSGPSAASDALLKRVHDRFSSARELAARLERLHLDPPASAAGDSLEGRFETIRRLIEADTDFRVYYTSQDGYDTHASQRFQHQQLLQTMGKAVAGFLGGLKASKLDDRVVLLVFSEFGRRLKENGNGGTDHGAPAPVFLAGTPVKGGLVGPPLDLTKLDATGDPLFTVDFRDVYATVLSRWLEIDPAPVLGERTTQLSLF